MAPLVILQIEFLHEKQSHSILTKQNNVIDKMNNKKLKNVHLYIEHYLLLLLLFYNKKKLEIQRHTRTDN